MIRSLILLFLLAFAAFFLRSQLGVRAERIRASRALALENARTAEAFASVARELERAKGLREAVEGLIPSSSAGVPFRAELARAVPSSFSAQPKIDLSFQGGEVEEGIPQGVRSIAFRIQGDGATVEGVAETLRNLDRVPFLLRVTSVVMNTAGMPSATINGIIFVRED